jgi:DNA replication protein DnaC
LTKLKRPKQFRYDGESHRDRIKLSPGETAQAQFKAWLAEKTAAPRFCRHHPRTRLALNTANTGVAQAHLERNPYGPAKQDSIEKGTFLFHANFRCPTCRRVYALCPPEFQGTTFETFDCSTSERSLAVARCRAFAAQVNSKSCGFMLLVGGPGCGKSRLACSVIGELEDPDSLYVRQAELTLALRATYGHKDVYLHRGPQRDGDQAGDDQPPAPLEIAQAVHFLTLDELGCHALAGDERIQLDELLKHRYEQRKPTILISNLPLDQLKQFLGDALVDRIVEATGNRKFLLQFSGESYRRTTGENYLAGLA